MLFILGSIVNIIEGGFMIFYWAQEISIHTSSKNYEENDYGHDLDCESSHSNWVFILLEIGAKLKVLMNTRLH